MTTIYLDLETYNEKPIRNGSYKYAETVEIMLVGYAIDDAPAKVWDVTTGELMPGEIRTALVDENIRVVIHNSMFDRVQMAESSFPISFERIHDTMVQALSHSLPGSLDTLCMILNIPQEQRKQKTGTSLVQLFCQPRPKKAKLRRATRHTHPTEWAMFVDYCRMDVEAMREVYKRLPKWNYPGNPDEVRFWHHDQRMNDRGIQIDTAFVEAAVAAAARAKAVLKTRAQELTDDKVENATKRAQVLTFIEEEYGIFLPDLRASTIEPLLERGAEIPDGLKELLRVRLAASTTSVSKYTRLLSAVCSDGRLRGTIQYRGASRTGRDAGRLFQPQNLPRPTLKQWEIDLGIEAVLNEAEELITTNPMELLSSALRGVIIAPPGKKLCVADLSNIEGRAQAWLATETWKLKAFEAFDKGTGHDLYKIAYGKSFGVDPANVTKDQRQIGKVQELALGYEGGVAAFVTFALAYGIDLDDMAERAFDNIPSHIMGRANSNWAWTKKKGRTTHGLEQKTWLVCESFKLAWREAHPEISAMWKELDTTIRLAIASPGETLTVRRLKIDRFKNWLRIKLPSGRLLCYPGIGIDDKGSISYMGMHQYTKKWTRLKSYGGKFFENICQAVACDVLFHNKGLMEHDGYQIVLPVHDEVITETPDTDEYNAEGLSARLAAQAPWAKGFPLAAAGFTTYRYKKGD